MNKNILKIAIIGVFFVGIIGGIIFFINKGEETEIFPQVVAMVPELSGFAGDIDQWSFGALLVTAFPEALEARFVEARAEKRSVAGLGE